MRLDLSQRVHALCTQLERSAHIPPPNEHLALVLCGEVCGSTHPDIAQALVSAKLGFYIENDHLILHEHALDFEARTGLLNRAALSLLDRKLISAWRNEALPVLADPKRPPVARIERAACRALGLTTFGVHLNAWVNGRFLLARRAAHKRINPGQWDTLVGGIVTANESERVALDREAFEEVGLALGRHHPKAHRRLHVWRPVPEGYQSEVIRVFDVELPSGIKLVNNDNEVDLIQLHSIEETLDAIESGSVMLEAALCILESLARHSQLDIGRGLYIK